MQRFRPTRREFIKTSAAAGIGFWISTSAAAESTSPNEKIRFACIGVAERGKNDTRETARIGDIVALCDIDDDRLGDAGERYTKAKKFNDWRELLDEVGQNIDAVTIAIPDHSHAVVAAAAMRLGKHVYLEKPLTHNLYEARILGQIAAEQKVATQMGNDRTALSGMRRAAAIIKSGILGPVKDVYVWTNRPIWPQGIPRPKEQEVPKTLHWKLFLGPAPVRPFGEGYHPFNWRGWWDFGTGSLGDMACHTMNLPFRGLDLRDPISVQAETTGHNQDSYPSKSHVTYEFAANDIHPALKLHWSDAKQKPKRELFEGRKTLLTDELDGDRDSSTPEQKPDAKEEKKSDAKAADKDGKDKAEKKDEIAETGALIIGEKGKLYAAGDYADQDIYLLDVDPVHVDFIKSPGHWIEFKNAIKGGEPAKSNFVEYAVPLTEIVLLGNLAIWQADKADTPGPKIEWDAKNLTAKNVSGLDELIKPKYRNGYSL